MPSAARPQQGNLTVEYAFTCIKLFFGRTKQVVIVDIDDPEADAAVDTDVP
jgi:hypothetical protein